MTKKLRQCVTAIALSMVMFMLAVPQVLWVKAAEAIKDIELVTIRRKVDNLPSVDATIDYESLNIVAEDTARRTANSKEFVLDNGMRMVKQYANSVHYLDNGVYQEIDKTENSTTTDSTQVVPIETGFKQINVFESGKITTDKELLIGKKDGEEKSDAYLQFEMAKKGMGYKLLYSKLEFSHETYGMSLLAPKSISYSVSMVENDIADISYENKPEQIGESKVYGSSINVGQTTADNKYEIDVGAIKDNTVTFAIQTEQANSAGAYSVMNTNQIVLISIYNRTYGLDENYGAEKVEIDGVQAYVDYDKNNLTVNTELFTVNSTGNTPISLSLVNNQGYEDIFDELDTAGIYNVKVFGNNTKLNFQQYTRKITDLALPIIVHYDADGSITQYYSTGNNYYHSYMGTMTLKEEGTTHYIYDASGNTSKFVNGRLTEIYTNDGQTTNVKENSEKIIISYDSLNRMSGISYYEGNNYNDAAYQITFEYLAAMGNNMHGITAKKLTKKAENGQEAEYATLLIYYMFYDSYGNISSIYNSYENIDAYNFEYDNTSENNIKFVNNRRLEGLNFEYDSANTVNSIEVVQGDFENAYNYTDRVSFQKYFGEYSRVITYSLSGGTNTATKGITLDGSRRVIAEWLEDGDGNTTVYAPGVWVDSNGLEYIFNIGVGFSNNLINGQTKKEVVHEIEKTTTSLRGTYSLSAGESITGNIMQAPRIESDTCAYALSFKATNASGATIVVNASGGNYRSITLPNCYETYVTMLCDFMGAYSDYILIESNKNVTISNVGYGIAEFTEEKRVLDNTSKILYTNNVTTKSSDGEQTNYTYDNKQEMTQQVVTNAQGLVETTLTFDAQKEDGNIVPTTEIRRNGDLVFSTENSVDESGVITQTTRDGNGNCVKEKVVNSEINDGNKKVTIIENGVSTIYYYGISGGDERLIRVESIDRLDAYTYNYFGEVLTHQIINKTNNEVEQVILSQQNTYTNGVLTGISYGMPSSSQTYNFNLTYDALGRLSQIKHNGTAKVTYNYASANNGGVNRLNGKTFANGNTVEYTYGTDGITNTTYKNSAGTVTDQYPITTLNSKTSSVSHVKGSSTNLTYTYNKNGYMSTLAISGLTNNLTYTTGYFDIFGGDLTAHSTVSVGATSHAISQTHNQLGQLTQYGYSNFNSTYGYDSLGKLSTYTKTHGTSVIESKSYEYENVSGELYDSNRVSRIIDNTNSARTQTLTYDGKDNIQSVTSNEKTFSYVYDNANRVTKDIYSGNGSYTRNEYYYDNNYNAITERKIYYGPSESFYVPIYFTYNTLGQLTFMNEYNEPYYFAYDEMGNPTKFKVSSPDAPDNFVWSQGRYLTSGTLFNTTFSYEYDANGIRYKKTVNNKVTEYYLNGTQILAENRIGHGGMIYYFYDATGVAGMIYGGNYYFYEKNAFGDVVKMIDSNGNEVASYEYNAWGELVALSGSMAFINPFRYRGYYCDEETSFYYLQSRYYCPNIMRFINADDYEIVGTLMNDPGQLYMYNYCNNNPVMYTDPSGHGILTILAIIIGTVIISGAINNGINAIYYNYFSDGTSDLTSNSYQNGYISRWDRLDYAKQQTGQDTYNLTAWMYYSEYSLHMYGWYLIGWAHGKGIPILSEMATSLSDAYIVVGEWDTRLYVNLGSILFGVLGI